MTTGETITKELKKLANKDRAEISKSFFKTYAGGYGEGDQFLGLTVPIQRTVAKKYYKDVPLPEIKKLLSSQIHEHRFTALEMLVFKYEKGDDKEKEKVAHFYLKNTKGVNNWDLVDTSAPYILGDWLLDKDRSLLHTLALSKNLWERRIAMVSTYACIQNGQFEDTLKLSELLLKDTHDLIHKACGWMLREVGKKSEKTLVKFLDIHYKNMPRTMLRYAIEKFPQEIRKEYLKREK